MILDGTSSPSTIGRDLYKNQGDKKRYTGSIGIYRVTNMTQHVEIKSVSAVDPCVILLAFIAACCV